MINKHLKALPLLALLTILFSALVSHKGLGQCTLDYGLSVDPPIPSSGEYPPGTTIELCYTIESVDLDGAGWLAGIGIDFPEGWDLSSVTSIDAPEACANGGTWIFFNDLNCNGIDLPPGFYYDVNSGGPEDGNPCNNYGDPCFNNANWQFCVEASLNTDCEGLGNQGDQPVTPSLIIYGDGDIGAWTTNTTCFLDGTNVFPPDGISFEINCCDAEPGISPGTLQICDNGPICLNNGLLGTPDPGGVWTGPPGWIWDGTDCAEFDPSSDPPGEYVYSAFGSDGCVSSVSVFMEYTDLGVVESVAYCDTNLFCLNDLVTNVSLGSGGTWAYPDGSPVTDCLINPLTDPEGVYTIEFYDTNNCFTTAGLDIQFGGFNSGEFTSYDYCEIEDGIMPFELMNGDPDEGGQWALFSNSDEFISFFPAWDLFLSIEYLNENLDVEEGFYLVYVLGAPPCPPGFDTLQVSINSSFNAGVFTQTTLCVNNADPVNLIDLINGDPDSGGTFVNVMDGSPMQNQILPVNYSAGDLLQISYSGGVANSSCYGESILEITFLDDPDAGGDAEISICENDTPLNMLDSLGVTLEGPQDGGVWTDPNGDITDNFFIPGISIPGTYTYQVANTCGADFATLIVNVDIDTDGDGICDLDEIVGCQNPNAINFNPFATDPGPCEVDGGLSEDDWELSEIQIPFGDGDSDWGELLNSILKTYSKDELKVYPNPNNGQFTLSFPYTENGKISIFNAQGRLIETISISDTNQWQSQFLNTSLPTGIYFLMLSSDTLDLSCRMVISM